MNTHTYICTLYQKYQHVLDAELTSSKSSFSATTNFMHTHLCHKIHSFIFMSFWVLHFHFVIQMQTSCYFHKIEQNKIKRFSISTNNFISVLSTRAKLKTRLVRTLMYLAIVFKVA